ncbi:MAG: maleate isomerase [Saprospiraceae bacterium]|jgi:maleate isomerase
MYRNFTPVKHASLYDEGPGQYRIGIVALSNDYVIERDFINMRPSDNVAIYTSRIQNTQDCTVETLQAMAPEITKAAALLVPEGRLDVVAYGCTSGTAVLGYDKVRSLVHESRPDVPVTTPLTSSLDALNQFCAQKIAVLTPYMDDINAGLSDFLGANGKTISGFTSFKIVDNEQMAKITADSIYHAAVEADRDDADALFISCTAIRAVDVVERIEQALGKPVVTAVQALFWQSLREAGCNEKVLGYGQLLRL